MKSAGSLLAPWILAVALACDSGDDELTITVRAEVVEPDSPVSVGVTAIQETDDGVFAHGVRVEWRGDGPRMLDDARFSHHVTNDDGDLVTAGRGCSPSWDDASRSVSHVCTADLQLIELNPGETHEYPVRVHPEVGPLRLRPGEYVVEEVIGWSPGQQASSAEGRFTVRLTYEVR